MYCHYCGSKMMGPYCTRCVSNTKHRKEKTGEKGESSPASHKKKDADDREEDEFFELNQEKMFPANKQDAEYSTDFRKRNSWEQEINYEKLMTMPHVRQAISRYAGGAKQKMTAEEFLERYDKAFKPLLGLSMNKIGSRSRQFYTSLGIKTGKTVKERFQISAGKVIVHTLCSLARNGQDIDQVEQAADGCMIRALIPSDLYSSKGVLAITIQTLGPDKGTFVEAATSIPGQMYDWGKSKRLLNQLLTDIRDLSIQA